MGKVISLKNTIEETAAAVQSVYPSLDVNPVRIGYGVKNQYIHGRKVGRTTLVNVYDFVLNEFFHSYGREKIFDFLPDHVKAEFINFKKSKKRKAA